MTTVKRNPSVQLALDGKPIYLHDININASVKRDDKDMSGQKSSTKKTDKGVKAKELNVIGVIPYERKEWLTNLFNLAEAENEKGEQVKYRVSCLIAEAINMREVQFTGQVSATEMGGRLAWQVSFTLREVNSIAEKKEQRKPKPKAKTQGERAPVAEPSKPTASAPKAKEKPKDEDNSFSKKVDDILGEL
ncbi:baseplate complex protein [Pasteurella multocida]|uniref:baseplate complex protein n=1 Tax=Pasteurella multocida TaxID=747 RepID=UPI00397BAF94